MTDGSVVDLVGALEALPQAHVLVIGDVMLDRYVYGEVRRISPEAPIPVFRMGDSETMLGGAGNVVRNLAALGASASFIAVVGDDPEGHALIEMVGREPRVEPYLLVERGRPTTQKSRFVAGGQQLLRADRETTAPIAAMNVERCLELAVDALAHADVLVLSDYAKGMLPPALLGRLIAAARAADVPVVADPKGEDFTRYRGATVLTPNRAELAAAVGLATETDEQIEAAAAEAIARTKAKAILVTRGSQGMSLARTRARIEHMPTEAREVYDVSGAGDTVIATFAAALAGGAAMPQAAQLANLAAGVVVGKLGTAAVYRDDLVRALQAAERVAEDTKIVSLAAAVDQVARWRARGQNVVFTNGCFDLLHPGHLGLIAQARAAGKRLVVGLNADRGVARLKGPGRPIQSEVHRAKVLASLAAVDLVILFEDDTPLELIRALKPEVLVKGADYKLDDVVGGDLVQGYGGRVLLAELTPGYSTTATLERVRR
ncbi:MAG: D-glycero-beta-D-manno-heptose-7-phosphate kinase [Alphaproteobacteria bacterium]|nr:D-glycero-beta-D-manno-heptose-7-phosphate kinase [Alphaproteobacteria bacterium]